MKILISYKRKRGLSPMGNGEYAIAYELIILKKSFFRLIKKELKCEYKVTMFESASSCEAHWDELIKNKTRLY